jgi:hypothetical protein
MTLLRSSQSSVAPWCGGKRLILNVYGPTVGPPPASCRPPPASKAETIADFMVLGHIMTVIPTINAIAAVVSAAPGIVTYTDQPLTLPRGVVAFGKRAMQIQESAFWPKQQGTNQRPGSDWPK